MKIAKINHKNHSNTNFKQKLVYIKYKSFLINHNLS